jgi:hypothetical protein
VLVSGNGTYISRMQEEVVRQIKKFEPLSVMRISAICYGALGLIEGAIFSVIFLVAPMAAAGEQQMPRWMGLLFGGLSIVIFPLMLGLVGAIAGGLGAVVYNVAARYVGGISVEVE